MKHLKIAGLCLVAMFAMSMVAAATAQAKWEQCETEKAASAATKYTEHQCITASGTGAWAWQEVRGTEEVRIKGSLELKDTKASILGASAVECYGEGVGDVGPGQVGIIQTVLVKKENCRDIEHCSTLVSVSARDTPWQTEAYDTEGKVLELLTGTNNGEPGWQVECTELGITENDKCTSEAGKPESLVLENKLTKNGVPAELLVLATFQKLIKAKCSLGGAKSGEVIGSTAVLKSNGWGLRVS